MYERHKLEHDCQEKFVVAVFDDWEVISHFLKCETFNDER